MTAATIFTARQKQQAITRELGFRRRVYAVRVAEGKMKEEQARYQIRIFEAIEADYQKIAADEVRGERLL